MPGCYQWKNRDVKDLLKTYTTAGEAYTHLRRAGILSLPRKSTVGNRCLHGLGRCYGVVIEKEATLIAPPSDFVA